MSEREVRRIKSLHTLRTGSSEDFRRLTRLCLGYLVTGLFPRRLDRWAVPRMLNTRLGVRVPCVRLTEGRMRSILESYLPNADYGHLATKYCEMAREDEWLRWRALHRRPVPIETAVEGLEHLRMAQVGGKGTILWGLSFCETLVVKIALHRAGVELVQLSTVAHGVPSPPSEFGMKWVGPLFCKAENRFLAERVNIPADHSLGYMRVLMKHLRENRSLYMAGEGRSIRSNVSARVFGQDVPFATGAPSLSWKNGSPLLPVYVVREGPLRYRAVIDECIGPDRDQGKDRFVETAISQFGERLEESVLQHPSDWGWWGYHTVSELLSRGGSPST